MVGSKASMHTERRFGPGRPCKIYLVDPVHNYVNGRDIWTIPLNVGTIAAYAQDVFGDAVEFRLFKFADLALQAIAEDPPDVVGSSHYIWNAELAKFITRYAKEKNPDVLTVLGGPNITPTSESMTPLLKAARCDYYISWGAEHPFSKLLAAFMKPGAVIADLHEDAEVHSVWYLDAARGGRAAEKPQLHSINDLNDIPSPFTNGMMDEFFDQDLMPMIETNRGCPFPCTFCDWGSANMRKVTWYTADRVKTDVDYCREHSRDERLMICDANFGILRDRDLEIAKYLRELRGKYGFPGKVIMTWSQAKSETILEIGDVLKEMTMMTTSSQSMNPEVLKNIKRRNISNEDWRRIVAFSKENNVDTYGELMLSLPGETQSSFLDAVRYLFEVDVDFININPLILLEGADLNTQEQRRKYGFVTRYRLMENCYGVYNGEPVIESQEMVIETNTLKLDEFILCRTVAWLLQLSWNLRRHDTLLRLLHELGVNPLDFLLRVIRDAGHAAPVVAGLFRDFDRDSREEYFLTRDDLVAHYVQPREMDNLRNGGFRKLNTHYSSRVSLECGGEMIAHYRDVAKSLFREMPAPPADWEAMVDDCVNLMTNRFLSSEDLWRLAEGGDLTKVVDSRFTISGYHGRDGLALRPQDFQRNETRYTFYVDEEQRGALLEHLKRFDGLSREYQLRKLQEPYHGIHKRHLLYRVATQDATAAATAAE